MVGDGQPPDSEDQESHKNRSEILEDVMVSPVSSCDGNSSHSDVVSAKHVATDPVIANEVVKKNIRPTNELEPQNDVGNSSQRPRRERRAPDRYGWRSFLPISWSNSKPNDAPVKDV